MSGWRKEVYMNKFFNVIQWIIGIFILVCSVGAFIMSIPAGICLIVCAFVVLPTVWNVFKAKGTYNSVMRTVRIILAVVLFAAAMLLTPELSVNIK